MSKKNKIKHDKFFFKKMTKSKISKRNKTTRNNKVKKPIQDDIKIRLMITLTLSEIKN